MSPGDVPPVIAFGIPLKSEVIFAGCRIIAWSAGVVQPSMRSEQMERRAPAGEKRWMNRT
jgi:hypothetical protein